MHVGRKAQKREKKAMSVSLYGNLFFVIVEIVMAIYTSSQAVLLDAVYDGVEFCMLLPSLFLIPLLYKPSNEKHPFGYMQIESMFVVVKGITMTGVTLTDDHNGNGRLEDRQYCLFRYGNRLLPSGSASIFLVQTHNTLS